MVEIHAQKRPGRPVLLTILSAVLLVVALLAAWAQTGQRRRLGPEQRVGQTPVYLRLPVGWLQIGDSPPVFGQPSQRQAGAAIRKLTVRYGRRETFLDPGRLRPEGEFRRVRIGPLPAVEYAERRVVRFGWRGFAQQTLVREACSPRGDWLYLEYTPARGIRLAEAGLFEAICESVRIEGLEPLDERRITRTVGVHFERPAGVQVVARGERGVRGVWLTGTPTEQPPWVIGVFRTFLVPFRGSDDLLRGLAVRHWELDESQVQIPGAAPPSAAGPADTAPALEAPILVRRREDGAFLLRVENPRLDQSPAQEIASAWVVEKNPAQVAMLLVFAGPQAAAAAQPVVERVAESLRFEDDWPAVDAAFENGRRLAELLTRRGALPWWGKLPPQSQYGGLTLEGPAAIAISRRLRDDDPQAGYAGCMSLLIRGDDARGPIDRVLLQHWQIDGHAQRYALDLALGTVRGGRAEFPRQVHESREEPDGPLRRRITDRDTGTREQRYALSESFVAPPIEPLAEWLVVEGAIGPAVIENSPVIDGSPHWSYLPVIDGSPHWSYLAALGASPDGPARLLRVDDDWPLGETRVLSEPGIADALRLTTGRLRRIGSARGSGFSRLLRAARRLCEPR